MKLLAILLLTALHISRAFPQDGAGMLQTVDSTIGASEPSDSLRLALLDLEVRKAKHELDRSDLWTRILPRITLSASFGLKNALFYDPESISPNIWPTDAVRLSLSLSLNDVLDFSRESISEIALSAALLRYDLECTRNKAKKLETARLLNQLQRDSAYLAQLLSLKERVVKFNEQRFSQGTISFDALTSAQLDLLARQHELEALLARIHILQHSLSNGGTK
jgi:outer membrane protein TolC